MSITNYQISPPVTGFTPVANTGSNYGQYTVHIARVYSYLNTPYGKVYSRDFLVLGTVVGTAGAHSVTWKWGSVNGASGYCIVEFNSQDNHGFLDGTLVATSTATNFGTWVDYDTAVPLGHSPTSLLVTNDYATFSDLYTKTRKVTLIFNDYATFSDSFSRERKYTWFERLPFSEKLHVNPRKLLELAYCTDTFALYRNATITDWNFAPDYKIFIGTDSVNYATTNWDIYAQRLGNIKKTVKHWTGNYEVGNWELELNNPENIIWGSFYNNNGDARYKYLLVRAMIRVSPLIYVNQFSGEIQEIAANNGKLSISVKDQLLGLSNSQFDYDYVCLGSSNEQGQWGVVKYVIGTNVMFDDRGYTEYFERKTPETTFGESLLGGVIGGALGFIAGGFTFGIGAALGFAGGFLGNLPQDSRNAGGYYRITDFNAIPDDTVRSGIILKFYDGSVSGNAMNGNGILSKLTEYPIVDGHFENGVYGTFALANTQGINVGDYVYVRKSLCYNGSPNEVIKAMLCGSNIYNPYSYGQTATVLTPAGMVYVNAPSNFASSWEKEMGAVDLINLSRSITPDENLKPFDLVKEILTELKISFYLDEENKFACKTIRPMKFSSGTIATYSEGVNILDNFDYKLTTDEVKGGIVYLFSWTGGGYGAYGDYNKRFAMPFPNSIGDRASWGTVESKWLHNVEEVETISYRIMMDSEKGVNRAELPTTLYGIIHNLSDYIRVATHRTGSLYDRLFEIESYSKNLDSSTVDLSLVDANNLTGYGNCKWVTSNETINTGTPSGHSFYGQVPGSVAVAIYTVERSMDAYGTEVPITIAIDLEGAEQVLACKGWYCCFGSLASQRTELFYVEDALIRSRTFKGRDLGLEIYKLKIQRGLFDTIQRPVSANSYFYALAPASKDFNGNLTRDSLAGKFNLGSTMNLNPFYGSVFKFF